MTQCKVRVWKRDTYRLKRGHGFKLNYRLERCRRNAATDDDVCWQHSKVLWRQTLRAIADDGPAPPHR